MNTSAHQAGDRHTSSLFLEKGMEQQATLPGGVPCGVNAERMISPKGGEIQMPVGKNRNYISEGATESQFLFWSQIH